MNINTYKLKNDVSIGDLLDEDFSYSVNIKYLTKAIKLKSNITLLITVNIEDFTLRADILNDDEGYFYMPFYNQVAQSNEDYELLYQVINGYDREMSNINCIELNRELVA